MEKAERIRIEGIENEKTRPVIKVKDLATLENLARRWKYPIYEDEFFYYILTPHYIFKSYKNWEEKSEKVEISKKRKEPIPIPIY